MRELLPCLLHIPRPSNATSCRDLDNDSSNYWLEMLLRGHGCVTVRSLVLSEYSAPVIQIKNLFRDFTEFPQWVTPFLIFDGIGFFPSLCRAIVCTEIGKVCSVKALIQHCCSVFWSAISSLLSFLRMVERWYLECSMSWDLGQYWCYHYLEDSWY